MVVLIVDDEFICRSYHSSIMNQLNFEVLEACDGVEALDVFERHHDKIGCVLTDYNMPRMNGLDMVMTLKHRYSTTIPFILLTSDIGRIENTEMLTVFSQIMCKPLSIEEFVNRCSSLVVK
ncbi:response regulator [Rickettsiales endosymbiont of Peranema trichophorum]|uniref:response regulator n=1 Tax=Rickettsiales endosymbiont of Peranema trichophorum TaxID=2486577 RepID=UPI0010236D73|nr:response regulator [Rickettsiales endosymbiont of Peranema trichophorum]RZI47607.1 response regulator [Rickettsiales endosymbiont of Peranema trichophorum]